MIFPLDPKNPKKYLQTHTESLLNVRVDCYHNDSDKFLTGSCKIYGDIKSGNPMHEGVDEFESLVTEEA